MEINYVLLHMRTQNVQCVLYDRPEDGFAYKLCRQYVCNCNAVYKSLEIVKFFQFHTDISNSGGRPDLNNRH